ncbi:serine/threonine-protein kinase [Streptomyces sp. NPDC005963]|uniref:serine/threonine-protein kinase n=1 Tax=Streptomyces sp. NPDC005963 TaxID=3156721 RepID=UPI0033E9A970
MENAHHGGDAVHSQGIGAGLVLAGRYRLAEAIGRGGMGQVWRAHDEVLHRVVAIKEMTAGMYATEADRAVLHTRTRTEARAAARISHPGVVTVHDVLDHDGRPWIVMEYVNGPSLADAAAAQGPTGCLPAREVARIGLEVLRALGAAHAAGVLHRDVKPANILLGPDGRARITDFGIAAIEGDSTITRTGEIVGSLDYLAPERVRGADPGAASDLWSLGATLYTAVEGTSPFRRTSPLMTMQAVVDEEPVHPQQAGPLAPVVMALLQKDPQARPSLQETEGMLQAVLDGQDPAAVFAASPTRTVTQPQRQPQPVPPPPMNGPTPPHHTPPHHTPIHHTPPQHTPYAPHPLPPPPERPRATGIRTSLVVIALAVVVGTGVGIAGFVYFNGERKSPQTVKSAAPQVTVSLTPTISQPPPSPAAQGPEASAAASSTPQTSQEVPEGWRRVVDPAGFSLLVPDGWERRVQGGQIDYTPDGGRHLLRIGIDDSPDYDHPHAHMLDLEKVLAKLPDYQRVTLTPNLFRDQAKSALWEFTWNEEKTFPGPRRAVDQMYFGADGTEYALYMSGPAEDWSVTQDQFDTVLRSWRPPN